MKNMLLGRRVIGELLLERIPIQTVPEDSDKAADWLHQLYRHKVFRIFKVLFFICMLYDAVGFIRTKCSNITRRKEHSLLHCLIIRDAIILMDQSELITVPEEFILFL